MIGDKARKLVAGLGELDGEREVLAEVVLRLADELDGDVPGYAVGNLSRALREATAQLTGSPGARAGLTDAEFDAFLRGIA